MFKKYTSFVLLFALLTLSAYAANIHLVISFQWVPNSPADNVTKYLIYQKQGNNFVPVVTVVGTNVGKVNIYATKLDPSYTFKVSAVNAVGESPLSLPVTWPNTLPITPSNVNITNWSTNSL
jgi:hypothetical protein